MVFPSILPCVSPALAALWGKKSCQREGKNALEVSPDPIKLKIPFSLCHQWRKTCDAHRCVSSSVGCAQGNLRWGNTEPFLQQPSCALGLGLLCSRAGAMSVLPLSWPRVSSLAGIRGLGKHGVGSCLLCFQEAPPEKTSLKHRGFPSAGIQMNPKQSPLQSCRLMSCSLSQCDKGPNEASGLQRHQLCFLSLISGKKEEEEGAGSRMPAQEGLILFFMPPIPYPLLKYRECQSQFDPKSPSTEVWVCGFGPGTLGAANTGLNPQHASASYNTLAPKACGRCRNQL